MNTKTKTPTPLPGVEYIPASQFVRHPHNRVPHPESVEKMRVSVAEIGVVQPITARPVPSPDDPEQKILQIVMGECRWLGCSALGENYEVPCFIRVLDDKEVSRLLAVENFQRTDLDALEQANAIQHMKSTGWNLDEISDSLGLTSGTIYRKLCLLKLGESAHEALREGRISEKTAEAISSLPEDLRDAALTAVVSPTHSAEALPERAAIELIKKRFREPLERKKDWLERKTAVETNHPGATWCEYERALEFRGYASGFSLVTEFPDGWRLSDHAAENRIEVPTWGELAAKHKAETFIGLDSRGEEAVVYVEIEPLIEAERAAHAKNPTECLFEMDSEDAEERESQEDIERRRADEREAARQLTEEFLKERTKIIDQCFNGLTKTAEKNLAEAVALSYIEDNVFSLENIEEVFAAPEFEDDPHDEKKLEFLKKRIIDTVRDKKLGGFEALGLLCSVIELGSYSHSYGMPACAKIVFHRDAFKRAQFPTLASALPVEVTEDEAETEGQSGEEL